MNDVELKGHVDKDKLTDEFHRVLRHWKNIVTEGIKCAVPLDEILRDDERGHGEACGFLLALKALPLSVVTEADIEAFRQELVANMHSTKAIIEVYKDDE